MGLESSQPTLKSFHGTSLHNRITGVSVETLPTVSNGKPFTKHNI